MASSTPSNPFSPAAEVRSSTRVNANTRSPNFIYASKFDKEAHTMASNELEVLDPAATVEKHDDNTAGRALNRRNLMAGLGIAGAAIGAGLMSRRSVKRPSVVEAASYAHGLRPDRLSQLPAQHQISPGDPLLLPHPGRRSPRSIHGQRHGLLSNLRHLPGQQLSNGIRELQALFQSRSTSPPCP